MVLHLASTICRPKAVTVYRILTFVMVLSLIVPGMAAARHLPPEAGHISACPFMAPDCGGPPPAAVPAGWTLAVCDTFDDNANGWLVGPNEDEYVHGLQEIAGGSYNWQMEALQDVISTAWLPDRTFGDLYVAVDMNWVAPPPELAQHGLMFRHFDPDNYYLFTVAAVLHQYSLQMLYRGQWETLIDWTEDPAIRSTGTNRLAVLAQGSSITMFVNGQQVAQYADARIAEGKVGVTATYDQGERIHLRFDNLEVRAPAGEAGLVPTPTSAIQPPATPLPTPTAAPQPQPTAIGACQHGQWLVDRGWQRVLCDEFADNANDWVVGEYTDQYARVRRTIENKIYQWETETAGGAASWAHLKDKIFTDFWVSTSAKMVSAPDSGSYGLIFRQVDDNNYYRFSVSETGHYRLDIYYQGQWGTLIDWSPSDAIRPGRVNDIAVSASGLRLSFYINREKVAEATDQRLTQGRVGLAMETPAGRKATVQFLDFEVILPSGELPTPPSPIVTLEPHVCDIPATAPAGWQTALCDLFLDNRNSWPVSPQTLSGGAVTRHVAAGTYGFYVEATQNLYYWVGYEGQTFTDFYAATSASIYTGKPETSYELVFRAADADNFYILSASGNYFQVAVRHRGAWQELIPWTFSDALRPKEFNQLAVLAQGPNLTFYINDVQVGSLTNDLIPAGQVGMGCTVYQGDTASIQFRSILVLVPPELATPVAPPATTLPPPPPSRLTSEPPTATPPPPPPMPTAPPELPPPTLPPAPSPAAVVTQVVAPAGVPYFNADWGVSLVYPSGWITMEESYSDYFSIRCGPSEEAMKVFDADLTPDMTILAPVMGVIGGNLADIMEVPAPDATGRAPSGEVLVRLVELLAQGFIEAGTDLKRVGDILPAQAAGAQGSQAEFQFPNNIGRMYIAAFTLPEDKGVFVLVLTPEDQQAAARQLFDSTLASFRVGGPPSAVTTPVLQPTPTAIVPLLTSQAATTTGQKWKCLVCGYVYDPAVGDNSQGVLPGTPFEALPDNWVCPDCGVGKEMFVPMQ